MTWVPCGQSAVRECSRPPDLEGGNVEAKDSAYARADLRALGTQRSNHRETVLGSPPEDAGELRAVDHAIHERRMRIDHVGPVAADDGATLEPAAACRRRCDDADLQRVARAVDHVQVVLDRDAAGDIAVRSSTVHSPYLEADQP